MNQTQRYIVNTAGEKIPVEVRPYFFDDRDWPTPEIAIFALGPVTHAVYANGRWIHRGTPQTSEHYINARQTAEATRAIANALFTAVMMPR